MRDARRPHPGARTAAILALVAGCAASPSCGKSAAPPAPPPVPPAPGATGPATPAAPGAAAPAAPPVLPTFKDVADEAGLVVFNHTGKPAQKDWLVSAMGGGTIALDYDSDGDIDLVVVDGTMVTAEGNLEYDPEWTTRLFRNDGGMRFTDVSKAAGVALQAFGFGGASCDYDADGHPDFFVACWGRSHLFRNLGDGRFEDVTEKAGVGGDERDMSTACAWGDVNGDGIHDLYVATYGDQRGLMEEMRKKGELARSARWRDLPVYVGPTGIPPQKDRLYLGGADGRFREVTATNLLEQRGLYGFQAIMTDVDNDGDLDVYVANDTQSNNLWVNDGKGVFTDLASRVGVATNKEDQEQAGMGVDAEDFDCNGWIDLTVTNFSHDYTTIYLNRSRRAESRTVLSFTDSSNNLGIVLPSWFRLKWGVRFADYDNDTWLDHISVCGHVYGEIDGFQATTQTSYRQLCQVLRNGGPKDYKLTDVTAASGPAFKIARVWRGASFGDFDDDGDVDMFATALNDKAALFRNDGGNRNGFVRFSLVGKGGQRDPSGARVMLHMPPRTPGDAERVHMLELHHGASFCSDNDPRMLFGLGDLGVVPQVDVKWPDGTVQTFRDVAGRRAYVVVQGEAELRPDTLVTK